MNRTFASFLIVALGTTSTMAQAASERPNEERRVIKVLRTKGRLPSINQPPATIPAPSKTPTAGLPVKPVATGAAAVTAAKSTINTPVSLRQDERRLANVAAPVATTSQLAQRIIRPVTTAPKQQIASRAQLTDGGPTTGTTRIAPLVLSPLTPLATEPLAPLAPLSSTASLNTGPAQNVSPLGKWLNKGFSWVDSLLGVKPVKPWQKATLAEPAMSQGGVAPTLGKFATKVFISKEASLGGNGVAGGGCGCK